MEKKEIIYGRNPAFEYLKNAESSKGIELYISEKAHGKIINNIISEAKRKNVKIQFKDRGFFSEFSSSSKHQGVLLKAPKDQVKKTEKDLLKIALSKNGMLVLLDQLQDPHNVGSIIRTAEALGSDGIIITKSHSSDITPTVIKSSAGATAYIDIMPVSNITGFLRRAKELGFWIIGTADEGKNELKDIEGIRPAIIVIGSENSGIRPIVKRDCDFIVKIPLKGRISSLNASVAAGIVMYEVLKERDK